MNSKDCFFCKEVVETITKKTIADSDKTGNVKREDIDSQEVINITEEELKTENTLVEDPKANLNKQTKNLNPFQLSRKTYKKNASNSGKKEEESSPYEKPYITALKNERGKTKEFKPSDPHRFMPKPDDEK